MDAISARTLQEVIRRESRSLLHYVGETFPWARPDGDGQESQLWRIISEQDQALGELGRALAHRHIMLPYLPSFSAEFTNINDVSRQFVLCLLVDSERRLVARLEHDMSAVQDPNASQVLGRFLGLKRGHLKTLEVLASPSAPMTAP